MSASSRTGPRAADNLALISLIGTGGDCGCRCNPKPRLCHGRAIPGCSLRSESWLLDSAGQTEMRAA